MSWKKFPYPDQHYLYTPASLKTHWQQLHTGDVEPFPDTEPLRHAWIAFHAGEFEKAAKLGLELGIDGYAVANKATCIYANYLESAKNKKIELYEQVCARCAEQQKKFPKVASGFYWHAYALGRHSQEISILTALAQGFAPKIRHSLDTTLRLAPKHADACIALGVYHAEIISKVGLLLARLTYQVREEDGIAMYRKAIDLNPGSAIARIEYANGLIMLKGRARMKEALTLYRQAAACAAGDAMERLDVQMALDELAEA